VGIYDRDYTRREQGAGTGVGGLVGRHSAVKVLLIANAVVFLLWQLAGFRNDWLFEHFTVSADGVLNHLRVHTLVTSAFSHVDLLHLAVNMLFVWWLGQELEESYYGARNFVFLYLLGAVCASLGHVALNVYRGVDIPALGASGAVMSILVVGAFLFPERPIYLFFGLFPVPLKWLVVVYVIYDLLPLIRGEPTGIAHAAHLGGALAGVLFMRFDLRPFHPDGRPRVPLLARLLGPSSSRPRLSPREDPRKLEGLRRVDDETEARVDEILRKIHREGITGLTDEEREFLKRASQRSR
jgi:membrane associated rhomboid family serine protease